MQPVRKQEQYYPSSRLRFLSLCGQRIITSSGPNSFYLFFLKRKEIALKQELQEEIKYALKTLRIQVYLTSCLYSSGKTSDNFSHTQNNENFRRQYTHVPKFMILVCPVNNDIMHYCGSLQKSSFKNNSSSKTMLFQSNETYLKWGDWGGGYSSTVGLMNFTVHCTVCRQQIVEVNIFLEKFK